MIEGDDMVLAEMTNTIGKYYSDKIVTAVVGIETDVNKVEEIGDKLSNETYVDDVFIVTGQFDIVIKVRFPDYSEFQKFVVERLSKIVGIKSSKTMMALSIKKEMGQKLQE